MATFAS